MNKQHLLCAVSMRILVVYFILTVADVIFKLFILNRRKYSREL